MRTKTIEKEKGDQMETGKRKSQSEGEGEAGCKMQAKGASREAGKEKSLDRKAQASG